MEKEMETAMGTWLKAVNEATDIDALNQQIAELQQETMVLKRSGVEPSDREGVEGAGSAPG